MICGAVGPEQGRLQRRGRDRPRRARGGRPQAEKGKPTQHVRPLRGRPVGLVVDDQHFIAEVDQAIDLADELERGALAAWGWAGSATIGTSARLRGPNSGANAGSVRMASVSLTMALRAPPRAAPALLDEALGRRLPARCGSVGRCCSSACVSVPRRKRPSLGSSAGRQHRRLVASRRCARGAAAARPLRRAHRLRGARARAGSSSAGSRGAERCAHGGNGSAVVSSATACLGASGRHGLRLAQAEQRAPSASVSSSRSARSARQSARTSSPAHGRAALEARDVEPVARARHRHVEQPVAFLGLERRCVSLRCRDGCNGARALDAPHERRALDAAGSSMSGSASKAPPPAAAVVQVSGRNTIGASSPLAPCTVITRTSLRPVLHVALHLAVGSRAGRRESR